MRPIEVLPGLTRIADVPRTSGRRRACATVEAVYRAESRRVLATLIRLLGDFDLAEEALHDAFAAALEQWPREGVPAEPARLAGLGRPLQGHRRDAAARAVRRSLADLASAPRTHPAAGAGRRGVRSKTTGCG